MHETKHRVLAPTGQRGFSMAEVLVAVALLSVILLAVFGLVTAGVNRAYSGKKMTEASVIAQHVMERVNVYAPQTVLGSASNVATFNRTWVRVGPADADTTPVANAGTTDPEIERDAIRALLAEADLPATTSSPATLVVTVDAVPTGDFTTASMVRIVVDLTWFEWGTRRRQVRLQALNLRQIP